MQIVSSDERKYLSLHVLHYSYGFAFESIHSLQDYKSSVISLHKGFTYVDS